MVTKGEKYESLRAFLLDSFTPSQFEQFLRLKDYNEVTQAVNRASDRPNISSMSSRHSITAVRSMLSSSTF